VIQTPCLASFGKDPHQAVGRKLSQALVRYPVGTATLSTPLTTRSQETTVRRCRQDVTGHCEGIYRCVSAPQVVFRWHQRADQALRGASLSINCPVTPTNTTQQYSDVKDKLDDLIPWLEKLLVTLAKADPNCDREEVERRSRLEKFVSRLEFPVHPMLNSLIDRWTILEGDR